MPVALANARRFKYSPAAVLMPLSFATLLGGLITLIGTPPNLLISAFRDREVGERFGMFDFAPVGIAVAAAGIAYMALLGWRLIPRDRKGQSDEAMFEIDNYISELRVPDASPTVGRSVADLEGTIEDNLTVVGMVRGKRHIFGGARWQTLQAGDILLVRAETKALEQAVKDGGLELLTEGLEALGLDPDELAFAEAVITPESWIQGYSPASLRLRRRHEVNLIALARQGQRSASVSDRPGCRRVTSCCCRARPTGCPR
jgi:di/tricarboxylate transporter